MRIKCLAIVFSFFILTLHTAFAEPGKSIKIHSKSIDAFFPSDEKQTRFMEMEFLGGLELSSKDKSFGGLSGIRLLDASNFIAITDEGKWLSGEIMRDGVKPIGIENARIGRLRASSGEKIKGKLHADSESIEISGDDFLIAFERDHRIERFSYKKEKLVALSKKPLLKLNDLNLIKNRGAEGIALAPPNSPIAGSILVFPEVSFDENGNLRCFIFKDGKLETFTIVPNGGFALTDAAFLPNGDLLVLERRFSLFLEFGMRVRLFDGSKIKPGAVLNGRVLLSATDDYEINNMEGLTVSQMEDGSTRLSLISDDNFSKYLQTIFLEFRLKKSAQ